MLNIGLSVDLSSGTPSVSLTPLWLKAPILSGVFLFVISGAATHYAADLGADTGLDVGLQWAEG